MLYQYISHERAGIRVADQVMNQCIDLRKAKVI